MSFHDVRLNTDISYGAVGGSAFGTTIQTTASGHEYRISRQARGRRRYQFEKALMEPSEWADLIEFWTARRGHLHGFRLKDWADYTSAADGVSAPSHTDQILGTGDGSTTQFQLVRTYPDAINPYQEPVRLPVAGTVLVRVGVTNTTAFTLTNPGGVITLASAPLVGEVVSAGYEFDRSVRFDSNNEWQNMRLDRGYLAAWPSIECVELLDEVQLPELWYPGGSEQVTSSGDVTLDYNHELWDVTVTVGSTVNAWLPAPDRMPGGPRVFVVHLNSASAVGAQLQLRDDAGNVVGSALGLGTTKRLGLSRGTSTQTWVVY